MISSWRCSNILKFTYHMINFIDTNKPRGQLKHVIPQRYDYELSVLRSLLDVRCHDRDLKYRQQRVS